jgi:DNA-directed RNA polymerase specialized sigma24 family protein
MSLAKAIAPHLPYLRRYARALTGCQRAGDAYVGTVLEAILAEASLVTAADVDDELRMRVTLYRVLARIWNSVQHTVDRSDDPAARSIESITPLPRQAFLLCSMEGFTPQQAAEVLECTERDVTCLLDKAGREIAEQIKTDVLIIEDEGIIAIDLAAIIESLGHRVVGRARTHREAIAVARRMKPGLVLSDIRLADDSSGLDAVNELLEAMNIAVIFITAFPVRLLTGQRPEPTFLITKPYSPDTVKAIVSQALFFGVVAGGDWRIEAMSMIEPPSPRYAHARARKAGSIVGNNSRGF